MKNVNEVLIKFLEDDEQTIIIEDIIHNINEQQNIEPKLETKDILRLLTKISNNHHRDHDFFVKIEKIIKYFQPEIKNNFTNYDLFTLFKENKRILLFLFEEKIIEPDKYIFDIIQKQQYEEQKYLHYFYKEFESFMDETMKRKINFNVEDFESYEQKRKNGENDSYICNLIRNDSIESFVTYINRTNYPLSSYIDESIFETNQFLLKNKKTALVEYAAFYGSIQIFQFLKLSGADLNDSLWLYAIHGKNAEIIHLLEEMHIIPIDRTYVKCLKESIKCHHNDIANYFKDNFVSSNKIIDINIFNKSFQFYNIIELYQLSSSIKKQNALFYFCEYNCFSVVDFILKNTDIDINTKKV